MMSGSTKMTTRHGFTAVELCLGLIVTSMVMTAVAAFSLAMSSAWKYAGKSQDITLLGNQATIRVQKEVQNARLMGAYRAGSSDGSAAGAALLLWKTDTNSDGYIQGNEVELIEHDTTAHTLRLYYSGQADAAGTWSYSGTFTASAAIDQFKVGRSYRAVAQGVYGAVFDTVGATGTARLPTFRYALKLMVDDSQAGSGVSAVGGEGKMLINYGAATIRAPLAQPSN